MATVPLRARGRMLGLLTVGTDCALGKKYTALAIAKTLQAQGVKADFCATGQTGILISGRGVAVDAVVADRLTTGNPHPGDDLLLRIGAPALSAAGVRPGDLLVASEGGGLTDAINGGAPGCNVRCVARAPMTPRSFGVATMPRPKW